MGTTNLLWFCPRLPDILIFAENFMFTKDNGLIYTFKIWECNEMPIYYKLGSYVVSRY